MVSLSKLDYRVESIEFVKTFYMIINLGDVREVQSLINRGVQLNYEYLGNEKKPSEYPLQHAIGRFGSKSTFKTI